MTTTTHTPATLRAMFNRNPRELDAVAAEVVMGYVWRTPSVGTDAGKGKLLCAPDSFYGKHPRWVEPSATAEIWQDSFDGVPKYSASLDAAALLEQRLAERGLGSRYGDELMWGIGICPCGDAMCIVGGHDAFRAITASAHDRTIAAVLAVLAAQEATK